jgi:hypothetical protein
MRKEVISLISLTFPSLFQRPLLCKGEDVQFISDAGGAWPCRVQCPKLSASTELLLCFV